MGVSPVPFAIGNSDRIIIRMFKMGTRGQQSYYFPMMGLRSQFNINDRERQFSLLTHIPSIVNELPLYDKARKLINAHPPAPVNSHSHQTANISPVRVFLFEITRSWMEKMNPVKDPFEIFNNEIQYFKPFNKPRFALHTTVDKQIKFVADISHLPFVPANNDLIMPFTHNAGGHDGRVKNKPWWYCTAFKVWDQREPDVALVFAYKADEPQETKNGFQPGKPVTLLYEMSAGELFDNTEELRFRIENPPRDISHLHPYIPGRCDLLTPFDDMDPGKVFSIEFRQWDAYHPNVVHVFGPQISLKVTNIKVNA